MRVTGLSQAALFFRVLQSSCVSNQLKIPKVTAKINGGKLKNLWLHLFFQFISPTSVKKTSQAYGEMASDARFL